MVPEYQQSDRDGSHGMVREPLLESLLAGYRYRFTFAFIRKLTDRGIDVRGFDIGCGYRGVFVERASKLKGVSFYGGDRWVAKENPRLVTFDFASPPALPERPNLVTMHAVLEHLNDPGAAVHYVYETLEPGGYLLLTAPSNAAKPILEFLAFKLKVISRQEIADHKTYFNKTSLIALLKTPDGPYAEVAHRYFQFGLNNRVAARKAK
jgi:2-polyprenyl-3-methyl-5-hydroxy-6-metoxy-1,4-benzoquinol methylase